MAALKCKQESSKLYQKRLLTLLPAIRNGSLDVNAYLRADHRTALHLACGLGSRQTVEWLLKNNASQSYVGSYGTPFMCTTDDNGPAIRKLLVQQSAFGVRGRPASSPLPDAGRREPEAILIKPYAPHRTCAPTTTCRTRAQGTAPPSTGRGRMPFWAFGTFCVEESLTPTWVWRTVCVGFPMRTIGSRFDEKP